MTYEIAIEKLNNWKNVSLNENLKWFNNFKKKKFSIKKKSLLKLKDWVFDIKKGMIYHKSNKFFTIEGFSIRDVNREVSSWDQPLVKQVGYVGGIIGLIRSNIDGIPHYLVQAKFEPGNYGLIQLSPTVQATFSNIKRVHKGKQNKLLKKFYSSHSKTIVKKPVSEDGGRFFKKTNIHWIVNYSGPNFSIDESFKWLTYYEIERMIKYKSIVNPHLRAILSLL